MKGFPRRGSDCLAGGLPGHAALGSASMKGFPRRGSDAPGTTVPPAAILSLNEGLPQKGKRS